MLIIIIGIGTILAVSLSVNKTIASHCHPIHTKTATASPTPVEKPAARKRVSNPRRQNTWTKIPTPNIKPVRSSVSSIEHRLGVSETLSLDEIYSRDFPEAILSIAEAVKAIQSGDRQTELTELSKALEKLITVHKAMESQVKLQYANSLHCPIMGSSIFINMVDINLTRDYKGQKIAFCCPGCPAEWDKLTEAQKQAKLTGVKS